MSCLVALDLWELITDYQGATIQEKPGEEEYHSAHEGCQYQALHVCLFQLASINTLDIIFTNL